MNTLKDTFTKLTLISVLSKHLLYFDSDAPDYLPLRMGIDCTIEDHEYSIEVKRKKKPKPKKKPPAKSAP